MIGRSITVSFVVLAAAGICIAQPVSVVAPGAQVVKLAGGFSFTEGPAVDAQGNVFFTDQPNDRICKWSVDGKLTDFLKPCGRANGMYFDKHGNLWACADLNNELWMIDPNGTVTAIFKDPDSKKLNGPNDLWMAPNGAIYFTDPLFVRNYWAPGPVTRQDGQYVHYLSPDRGTFMRVATDLVQPNGIIGTPDGNALYVADYGGRKTYAYKINEDGTLADKRLFAPQGSDGMTIDIDGNVYLTSGVNVSVYTPAGAKLQDIRIPEGPANVTFGGKDNKTLFITARTSLYALEMAVAGAPTAVQMSVKLPEDEVVKKTSGRR